MRQDLVVVFCFFCVKSDVLLRQNPKGTPLKTNMSPIEIHSPFL